MSKNKWIYDSSTGIYHNTDMFVELSVEEMNEYGGENQLHHIVGTRTDGRHVQISGRVQSPDILHDIIRCAVGEVEDG